MAKLVDEKIVAEIQRQLLEHFRGSAVITVAGPELQGTDECSTLVVLNINGAQYPCEFEFAVKGRPADAVVTELIGQIVRWMQAVRG